MEIFIREFVFKENIFTILFMTLTKDYISCRHNDVVDTKKMIMTLYSGYYSKVTGR